MTNLFTERDETPTIEVRIYRHGELIRTELVESDEQAALVIEERAQHDGITCEVDDLSVRHRPGDILAPEPEDLSDEPYSAARGEH